MVWADGPFFEKCDTDWQPGQFFKIRGVYGDHIKYGPQIEVEQIRHVLDRDATEGFNPADFGDRSRFDPETMLAELQALIDAEIADVPLRQLVRNLIDRHADRLKVLPATLRNFYPFRGGWLEHTLAVARTPPWLAGHFRQPYAAIQPPPTTAPV